MDTLELEKSSRRYKLPRSRNRRKKGSSEIYSVILYGKNNEGIPEDYPKQVFKLKKGSLPHPGSIEMTKRELVHLMASYSDFKNGVIYKKKLKELKEKRIQELKEHTDELCSKFIRRKYPLSLQMSFMSKVIEAEEYLSLERVKEDCHIIYEEAKEVFHTQTPSNTQMVQLCEKIIIRANGDGKEIGYKQYLGRVSGRYSRLYKEISHSNSVEDLTNYNIMAQFSDLESI